VGAITHWVTGTNTTTIYFFTGTYTSTSGGTLCYMRGHSEGQILSGGTIVADSGAGSATIVSGDPFFAVTPGGRAYAHIVWTNWCSSPPAGPISMAIVLPSGLGRVVINGSGIPVPACTDKRASSLTPTTTWTATIE
jgi:hypothetical protein